MKPKPKDAATGLRHSAELRLRVLQKGNPSGAGDPKSAADTQRLLHELQVHQVELELQNEELQKARDEMEAGLEKYSDLYDFAPVGYFTLAADGSIRLANLTGAKLVGIERSRLVGQPFVRLVAEAGRPGFDSFLKKIFTGPAKETSEFELLRPGQPARFVSIEAQPLLNGQECRAVVVDITARKRAEDKVRVSEVRYRRLFEAAHDGVLLLDPGTRKITDANPFMTKLLGYPHDQLVGKELFEIGLLKDETASQEMFRKLKRQREVRYEDLPLESSGGRHQEVEVVANLYQENDQTVIQCNIRDITVRKQAEEILRRNEALFAALVAEAPVGVYVVDAAFRLQQLNPTAQLVFEKVHPLIGRDFSEIIHSVWPERVANGIVKRFRYTLKTGRPYQTPEFAARRRDIGQQEIYEWQIQRVTLPAGEHGVVCFFSNITERKQAEAARRRLAVLTASNQKLEREIVRRQAVEDSLRKSEAQQRHLLEQSRHLQSQLRSLSHQILSAQEEERKRISRELHDVIAQTLVGINIHLAALTREAAGKSGRFQQRLGRTQRLVEEAVQVVHQFARELRPTMLDDLGLIPALHSFMKNFTTQTGVRTRLTAFATVEQLDMAQRTVLFRVAQEALTNVARHAQASRAEVYIQKLPDGIRMEVKDNGKSFGVERVWHRKGRGRLGLLGMRERLEMVGGKFSIESAPGQGTVVRAQIPLRKTAGGGRNSAGEIHQR